MTDFSSYLAARLAAGDTLDDALAQVRRLEGAHPVAAIKAISAATGVSLGEAKRIFDASPSWRQEVLANRALHGEAITALLRNSES